MRWVIVAYLLFVAHPARAQWWATPAERVALTTSAFDDGSRPYDVPRHARLLAGNLALSCEHIEGRPCGSVAYAELDSHVGYRDLVSLSTRLRTSTDDIFELDRAHLDLHYKFASAKLGRDVVHIGPAARTVLSWGDHPPPLDHARFEISTVHATALYLIGRLREPQRFPGTLVTIGRGELDFGRMSVGIVHMLQLEGEGARHLGFVDFVLEHIRRKDISAGESDSSNRRFGGDATLYIPELHARLYYILIFEYIRKARVIDAIRYDADHLLGVETSWATAEYHATAARSQEHSSRTTGFTNGGYVVGSPLGPDARSFYVAGHVRNFTPWFELVRFRNRMLQYVDYGPITPISEGADEGRFRIGIHAAFALRKDLTVEAEAMYEHVDDFAFEPFATTNNGGARATLVWLPRF